MTGFTPYDLQPPERILTPAVNSLRGRRPVEWFTLPEPAEGHVWVRLSDDYYEGMQWEVVQPGRTTDDLRRTRQITVEQLDRWNAAKAAMDAAQEEAWKLYAERGTP